MQFEPEENPVDPDIDGWFKNIVKRVRPEHIGVLGSCPDRYVGLISTLAGKADWSDAAQGDSHIRPAQPCVVLVLESPHIEEYSSKYSYTPWPANGETGKHVRRHVAAADLPIGASSGLVLMNAIPFQCSLGERPIGPARDAVFRLAWNSGGREFFQRRLRHWCREGDLLVNACTVGRDGLRPLREEVEEAIETALPSALRFRRYHPFRWFNPAMAAATWTPGTSIAQ
ncbi:MAG: hypothetical protein KIS62_08125 [Ramlibacter sp.]|nr:hypothetical protein [Ramlibacter sp.]